MSAKMVFGGWTFKAFKLLAKLKGLRGGALDIFGKTEERRMERQLIADYEALVAELLAALKPSNLELATKLARLPETIRGYGHVKHANVVVVRAQQKDLLDRFHGRVVDVQPVVVAAPMRVKGVAEL